jgi:hypothetical protein
MHGPHPRPPSGAGSATAQSGSVVEGCCNFAWQNEERQKVRHVDFYAGFVFYVDRAKPSSGCLSTSADMYLEIKRFKQFFYLIKNLESKII